MVTNGWFAQDPGDSQDAVFRASWNNLVTPWGLSYSGYLFHFSDPPVHKDTRNSSVPATTTQLADIIVFWHSVNKGSRNLCALLAWESVQKPLCLLCSAFAGLPVKIGAGGGILHSPGSWQEEFHQPSVQLIRWANVSHLCFISANHPWGVQPPPISREAFNEDWPNSSKNRSRLVCD